MAHPAHAAIPGPSGGSDTWQTVCKTKEADKTLPRSHGAALGLLQIPKAVVETHPALRHPSARDEAALLFYRALLPPLTGPAGLGQAALAVAGAVQCPAVPVSMSPSPQESLTCSWQDQTSPVLLAKVHRKMNCKRISSPPPPPHTPQHFSPYRRRRRSSPKALTKAGGGPNGGRGLGGGLKEEFSNTEDDGQRLTTQHSAPRLTLN